MRPTSPILAFLLALSLAITAQGMAFARGKAPAEGRMVLCTGQGAVMVYTDAEGRPTSPPQLCADGAQALFAASLAAPAGPLRSDPLTRVRWTMPEVSARHADRPPLSARDPPRR